MPNVGNAASRPYKRILAVKLADLGDLLSVTPALQALRAAHPTARIDLLVPPSSAALLKNATYIDRILTFDKFPFDRKRGLLNPGRLLDTARFVAGLRLARYDAVVLFHHFATRWGAFKFAGVALASGAKVRAGLDNGRGFFLNVRVPDRGFGAFHEIEYWLQVAEAIGANASGPWRPDVPLDAETRDSAASLLNSAGVDRSAPLVAVHPGAGWYSRARIWPVQGFAAVARGLARSHGATVLVLGGPDETETAGRLVGLAGPGVKVLNLVGQTTVLQTAALIERCDLFVGNDSGPMHLAAAVRTPVVAVFGPSNRRAWGPYTPPGEEKIHTVVSRDLPCMPCFYRGYSVGLREGCGTRECLTLLDARPVLEACRRSLDRSTAQRGVQSPANHKEGVPIGEP